MSPAPIVHLPHAYSYFAVFVSVSVFVFVAVESLGNPTPGGSTLSAAVLHADTSRRLWVPASPVLGLPLRRSPRGPGQRADAAGLRGTVTGPRRESAMAR